MKNILITGASSGIGEGLARHYAGPGVTLTLVARRRELLRSLAGELEERGAVVRVHQADVADTDAMKRIATELLAGGGVDLVIANAGMGSRGSLRSGDAADVAQVMRVNVIGVTNTIVPFVPAMVARRSGVLVAIASAAGFRGLPSAVGYSASKAAVIAFMEGLRMDLVGTGVHALTVCPGYVRTPMTAGFTRKLPFLVELDRCVAEIAGAIERRASDSIFPWQVRLLRPLFRSAPEWLIRKLAPPRRHKPDRDGGASKPVT